MAYTIFRLFSSWIFTAIHVFTSAAHNILKQMLYLQIITETHIRYTHVIFR